MISLTPYSRENPVKVSLEDYEKLVHNLREGCAQGKIAESDFHEREEKMVVGYWNRGS